MKQIYLGTSQTLHINHIFRGVINPGDIIDIPDDLYETEFKNHKKWGDAAPKKTDSKSETKTKEDDEKGVE